MSEEPKKLDASYSRAYKTEILLTEKQKSKFDWWIECSRRIYNDLVEPGRISWEEKRLSDPDYDWSLDGKIEDPEAYKASIQQKVDKANERWRKRPGGRPPSIGPKEDPYKFMNNTNQEWLKTIPSTLLGRTCRNYQKAWRNYNSQKSKGNRWGPPKAKSRREHNSFSLQGVKFCLTESGDIDYATIHIPIPRADAKDATFKNGVKLAEPIGWRIQQGNPSGLGCYHPNSKSSGSDVTFSKVGGRWYASFPCKYHRRPSNRNAQLKNRINASHVLGVTPNDSCTRLKYVGVDANTKDFTCSDGTVYKRPDLTRIQKMIRDTQRQLSHMREVATKNQRSPYSKRYITLREKLQRLVAKEARIREQWVDRVTYDLAIRAEHVVIEDLSVKNMTRSAKGTTQNPGKNVRQKSGLNREILKANFGKFRSKLEYKTKWYGSHVTVVDPRNTSQICSDCGNKQKMRLSQRVFQCESCGMIKDRDLNAAINIERRGNPAHQCETPGYPPGSGPSGDDEKLFLSDRSLLGQTQRLPSPLVREDESPGI